MSDGKLYLALLGVYCLSTNSKDTQKKPVPTLGLRAKQEARAEQGFPERPLDYFIQALVELDTLKDAETFKPAVAQATK